MASGQQLDGNYKPVAPSLYDPTTQTLNAALGGPQQTGSDGTKYSATADAPVDGYKATYSAAKLGLVPASSPTDIFTITGSSTKTIRVTRIEFFGVTNSAVPVAADVVLLMRSTANSGGTSTGSPTPVPHDSSNPAVSATVLSYTANPTTGSLVGTALRNVKYQLALSTWTATDFPAVQPLVWDFGVRPSQCPVLRGTGQVLAINLNGVSLTGTVSLDIAIEWTEE